MSKYQYAGSKMLGQGRRFTQFFHDVAEFTAEIGSFFNLGRRHRRATNPEDIAVRRARSSAAPGVLSLPQPRSFMFDESLVITAQHGRHLVICCDFLHKLRSSLLCERAGLKITQVE